MTRLKETKNLKADIDNLQKQLNAITQVTILINRDRLTQQQRLDDLAIQRHETRLALHMLLKVFDLPSKTKEQEKYYRLAQDLLIRTTQKGDILRKQEGEEC